MTTEREGRGSPPNKSKSRPTYTLAGFYCFSTRRVDYAASGSSELSPVTSRVEAYYHMRR
jgi:hypothetical protein